MHASISVIMLKLTKAAIEELTHTHQYWKENNSWGSAVRQHQHETFICLKKRFVVFQGTNWKFKINKNTTG